MSKINKPYASEFSGEQIDERLRQVAGKVDKEPGKGLSSNDFTDELKEKLERISDRHPYISLERLRKYLYRVTFDSLPEDNGSEGQMYGGCSSFVRGGKLYRNLDFNYDNAASFIIRTRDFEGMSFVTGLNDGAVLDDLVSQLPYRVVDGRNNHGIMVSTHVLFNDWQWTGCGAKSVKLTRLPFLALSKVRSMATIEQDLSGILDNLEAGEGLASLGYLIQVLVTDGTTTYALMPPTSEGMPYALQDITSNPKLTNFRWVASEQVDRQDADLQTRPTGIERWNLMPCALQDLRFTKAYESQDRLSEFIGLRGTTKDSTDAELFAIYQTAHEIYRDRVRDGQTWQTMHSVVYGDKLESLFIQENWVDDCVGAHNGVASGYLFNGVFYEDETHKTAITPNKKVIYVNLGVETRDLYIYDKPSYMRVGVGALTKEQADQLYAPKEHGHSIKDIQDIDFLSEQQIINILNN